MKAKLFASAVVVLIATSGLVFAGGQGEETADEGGDSITMWVRTPETLEMIRSNAEAYMEENPGTEIEIVEFSADAYPGALQSALSGDDLPDVFQTHNSVPLTRLESLDQVQPIGPLFSEGFEDRFEPAAWWEGSTTIDGTIYGWPDRSFRRASLFMYYNKEVMEDAGLDPDDPPRTWEEILRQGRRVNQESNGDVNGIHMGFTSDWFIERVLLQLATTVSDDTGVPAEHLPGKMVNWKTGDMFDYEALLRVIDFLEELEEENAIHPNYLTTDRSQATAQWAAGQAAFLFDGSWRLSEILSEYSDTDFGITMLPARDGDAAYWGVAGGSQNAFVVSENSPSAELAVDFFEYLTDNYYPQLLQNAVDLSPIEEINDNEENHRYSEFQRLVELTYEGTKVLPSPQHENPDELETVTLLAGKSSRNPLGPTIQGYLSGERLDVEEYLQEYSEEQNRFLEEALDEAAEDGADVSEDNWVFPDWEKSEDYY